MRELKNTAIKAIDNQFCFESWLQKRMNFTDSGNSMFHQLDSNPHP